MPPYSLIALTAWLGVTASGLAAGCAHAQSRPVVHGKLRASTVTPYRQLPVQFCLDLDAATAKALRDGTTRLFLHIQNQQPSYRYSPSFLLRLVEPGTARRLPAEAAEPAEEFSMHPDHVSDEGKADAQHFSFDLSDRLPSPAAAGPLCLEVGIDLTNDVEGLETRQVKITAALGPAGG